MPSPSAAGNRLARIVFAPVYFFIEKVRFARSFLLLFLLLPDLYVAFLLVQQTTKDVQFSAKESIGIAYIAPVRAFLANVQQFRVISSSVGVENTPELVRLMAHGDELITAIEAAELQHGAALDTTETWHKARDLWGKVKTSNITDSEKRDGEIAELTSLVAAELIVNKAGNNSNLILDPDLDSYWLMDAYVFKLPALGELAANAGAAGIRAGQDGKLTMSERLDLAATLGQIASTTSDLINIDLKTAIEDNERFAEGREGNRAVKPALEHQYQETAASLQSYVEKTRTGLLVPETPTFDPQSLAKSTSEILALIQELQTLTQPQLDRLCLERVARYEHTRLIGIITFLIAALLISYVFNGFTSSVRAQQTMIVEENSQLQADILGLLTVVSDAADGDLTARAKVTQGTLGNVADAFNQMMESWQQLIGAIIAQLDKTNHAVAELRAAAGTMATGASRQAVEVLAATTSVQRMSEEIGRVSGNAETAAAAAARTKESAITGADSVQTVVVGMDSLRALVQAGAKKIKTLGDRSMEINSIVGTITKISEQTNMLALNAAIEAARAGEQGRGFSVVADEVRKLAERTATATQEIEKLVRGIQAETTESVAAIERQTQVVEEEGRAVADAGNALSRIQGMSTESSALVGDIATIAKAQVADATTVVGTMQRISTIAKDTESSAQGSLGIAQELGELSAELRVSVNRFKVG